MTPLPVRVAVLAIAIGTAAVAARQAPTIRIVEPRADTLFVGESTISVDHAADLAVRLVVVQVDGVEACRFIARPYRCRWDAGSLARSRNVRAVATLENGTRAIATVRTRDVGLTSRSNVESVLVSAHVTDDRGRFVPGLTAADFAIQDDGVAQAVTLVGTGDVGAEVFMAIDVSQSMEPLMPDLRVVVRSFLDALRPVDTVTIGVFNNALRIIAPAEATPATRVAALERLRASGDTALYDAMVEGAEVLRTRPGKRALVTFTDGHDVASRASASGARVALQSNDVILYFIGSGKAAEDHALRTTLEDIALETGGAAYFEGRLLDTADRFRDIVGDLSSQYLLSFSPAKPLGDGRWRPLKVSVKNSRLRVRARQGYFAVAR
jgi:VWFA-related protein